VFMMTETFKRFSFYFGVFCAHLYFVISRVKLKNISV
jgi:hypothetical protein